MTNCAYCGKPKYDPFANMTATLTSTVWPYCQCNTLTVRLTLTNGTTTTGWGVLAPYGTSAIEKLQPKQEVPQLFQEAFKDGELDI